MSAAFCNVRIAPTLNRYMWQRAIAFRGHPFSMYALFRPFSTPTPPLVRRRTQWMDPPIFSMYALAPPPPLLKTKMVGGDS